MGEWDIKFREQQLAAHERAKEQLRWLVEQKQLRAAEAEAEAKLRSAADVKSESGGPKTKLIRAAALAIWGPDGPPKNLPPQVIFQKVAGRLQTQHVSVGKTQVRRALGLK